MKKLFLSAAFAILSTVLLQAEIKLPAILGDHMVLQQQTSTYLWGTATANKQVIIKTSWDKKSYTCAADAKGNWKQLVSTPSAGGPFEITISDGKELKIKDVLIGEVWLCSGQSNMQQTMKGNPGEPTFGSQDMINLARPERNIRVATVKLEYSRTPLNDCSTKWELNTPDVVTRTSAAAYYFANYVEKALNIPVGLICSSWGGSRIEPWMDLESFKKFPDIDLKFLADTGKIDRATQLPTLLYNAMIFPLINYSIKGALWYQGESNRGNPAQYEKLFHAMAEVWRRDFRNPEMPIYFTQIAPFGYNKNENPFTSGFFYECQANILRDGKNFGMAVTVDTGEYECIHPAQKQEVGERLAYWALAECYGLPITYKSPIYKSMEVKEGKAMLDFDGSEFGLWSPVYDNMQGFEIAGADKVFHPAKATLFQRGRKIEVSSDKVAEPVAVRYCFRDFQMGKIYNNAGLPLAPFRTDKWDDVKK